MKTDELRVVTKSKLERDMIRLGLASGQTVMLHASVKAIGWAVRGPDVVIQAQLDILGDEGTLMCTWAGMTHHTTSQNGQKTANKHT